MTIEIPQDKWSEFFDDLSRRRYGWTTRVEVMDETIGDQVLADGLPLNGVTFEEKSGKNSIVLAIGETSAQHQSHVIANPVKVEFLRSGDFEGGVLEIEDENRNRTLVSFLSPMPIYVGYENYAVVMASSK